MDAQANLSDVFFLLMRLALNNDEPVEPFTLTAAQWQELWTEAGRQAVQGLLFEGVQKLPEGQWPPKALVMQWAGVAQQIAQRNRRINAVAAHLSRRVESAGYHLCVLKGQGNALLYPNPLSRAPGDIDAWVDAPFRRVIAYVRCRLPKAKADYHHVDAGLVGDVPVEAHYRPAFVFAPHHNRRLQRFFHERAEAQFLHAVALPEAAGTTCVPTAEFNRVYQLVHIQHHLLREGIGLRHIIDYAQVLRCPLTDEERAATTQAIKQCGLRNTAGAMSYVCRELLNIDESLLPAAPDERHGRFLLREMMRGGNFGQHGHNSWLWRSALGRNIARLLRDIRLLRLYPSECFWEPLFRWWHFFWRRSK